MPQSALCHWPADRYLPRDYGTMGRLYPVPHRPTLFPGIGQAWGIDRLFPVVDARVGRRPCTPGHLGVGSVELALRAVLQ